MLTSGSRRWGVRLGWFQKRLSTDTRRSKERLERLMSHLNQVKVQVEGGQDFRSSGIEATGDQDRGFSRHRYLVTFGNS